MPPSTDQSCAVVAQTEKTSQEADYTGVTHWWGRAWFIVILLYSTGFIYTILRDNPQYFRDWRAGTIILLSLLIIGFYSLGMLALTHKRNEGSVLGEGWPPPLTFAGPLITAIYIVTFLLTLINQNFAYDFYIVFGIGFAVFSARILIFFTSFLFLTFCLITGILSWPFNPNNLGALVGIAMSFFSTLLLGIALQNAVVQRNRRNTLLQELRQTHADLEQAHQQLAEAAAQQQELAILRERTRLAREMHDTLGHALVLISVKLEAAQRLRERDPLRCEQELESTKEIARESMKELRASIANLRSPTLEREPACRAISRYARDMAQRVGLHVDYDLHPDIEGLPEQVEATLWKVGQEALTNVEKHAHASNVLLHISRQPGHIYMKIQDDGIGLPQEFFHCQGDGCQRIASPDGHYGLSGMLERVEQLKGRLTLRPAHEHGTMLEVELPLVEEPLPHS